MIWRRTEKAHWAKGLVTGATSSHEIGFYGNERPSPFAAFFFFFSKRLYNAPTKTANILEANILFSIPINKT